MESGAVGRGGAGSVWSVGVRSVVAMLLFMSAVTAFVLSAVPTLALNSAFDDKIRDAIGHVLGLDPLGWLPSFQPLSPTWYVSAYLALIFAIAAAAFLVWRGNIGPGDGP